MCARAYASGRAHLRSQDSVFRFGSLLINCISELIETTLQVVLLEKGFLNLSPNRLVYRIGANGRNSCAGFDRVIQMRFGYTFLYALLHRSLKGSTPTIVGN